jgi:hypothetical protein
MNGQRDIDHPENRLSKHFECPSSARAAAATATETPFLRCEENCLSGEMRPRPIRGIFDIMVLSKAFVMQKALKEQTSLPSMNTPGS